MSAELEQDHIRKENNTLMKHNHLTNQKIIDTKKFHHLKDSSKIFKKV